MLYCILEQYTHHASYLLWLSSMVGSQAKGLCIVFGHYHQHLFNVPFLLLVMFLFPWSSITSKSFCFRVWQHDNSRLYSHNYSSKTPLRPWVIIIKPSGFVACGHCTCKTGQGETCSDVKAVLSWSETNKCSCYRSDLMRIKGICMHGLN